MLEYLRGTGKHTKAIWWVLIIVTVVTFLGGFVFIFGSGLGSGSRAKAAGVVATVDGSEISRTDFQNAITDQNEKVNATVVGLLPDLSSGAPTVSDADLDRAYDRYKNRFWTGPERQLEVLVAPKTYGAAEIKTAQDLAQGLVRRLRAGENYVE